MLLDDSPAQVSGFLKRKRSFLTPLESGNRQQLVNGSFRLATSLVCLVQQISLTFRQWAGIPPQHRLQQTGGRHHWRAHLMTAES